MFTKKIKNYINWLHLQWPAGVVEKLPEVNEDFSTNIPGLYIVGDLTGIPLLKFSSDSGARAVQSIISDNAFQKLKSENTNPEILDLAIIGAGVSGMAAALESKKNNLRYIILEASEPFSTIVNFPKGKPIYTYPTDMIPAGDLQFTRDIKEPLIEELKTQTLENGIEPVYLRVDKVTLNNDYFELEIPGEKNIKARKVIVGIGRSGNFRKLGVPGEDKEKVFNRLHDPIDFEGKNVLVVGGGDSALEASIALASAGAKVTHSYRKAEFSRPKPENIESINKIIKDPMADVSVKTPTSERITTSTGGFMPDNHQPGSINLLMPSHIKEINDDEIVLVENENEITLKNDAVFTMIGREAPLDFFRRSNVKISGEMNTRQWIYMSMFLLFCAFVYHWKSGGPVYSYFQNRDWFPFNIPGLIGNISETLSSMVADPSTLIGTLTITIKSPGFYYSLVYTLLIIIFGIRRVKRRKTPYIKYQTLTLAIIQIFPLFLLPYFILPISGALGAFDTGFLKVVADELFPIVNYDHGREYWRAFGFILAWPLFVWNVFSSQPLWGWLTISFIQTFVIIPLMIYFWGKGSYCGWICSCGAMAETLGDNHRHKMPHGEKWNKLNMLGQVILLIVFILLVARIISWISPGSSIGQNLNGFYAGLFYDWKIFGIPLNYKYVVDLFLAGIIGYGLYFWFSGRVWCRFACPLAALMHIYARFSRFAIIPEKKKCISCNVCTSVCHQGIDVMNFANKGLPMRDPECVRCSACVQSCPTGVLQFGQINLKSGNTIKIDSLKASAVRMKESQNA